MKRHYLTFLAQSLVKSDDPDNKNFGELILQVIPEDDKQIPTALIEDIKADIEQGIRRESAELNGAGATSWTQERALAWIAGSPFVDDPRPGWTKHDLAMFARGYAVGRSIQKGNDDETLHVLLMSLDRILENING